MDASSIVPGGGGKVIPCSLQSVPSTCDCTVATSRCPRPSPPLSLAPLLPPQKAAANGAIAGYLPATSVTQHARIDLDQYAIEACFRSPAARHCRCCPPLPLLLPATAAASPMLTHFAVALAYRQPLAPLLPPYAGGSEAAWEACARDIYENGEHSAKADSLRTIQGFSTSAESKFKPLTRATGRNFTAARAFRAYFGDWAYADEFIAAALDDSAPWDSLPARFSADDAVDARKQAVKKGTGRRTSGIGERGRGRESGLAIADAGCRS